jgi:8-oxo-dGTP pyrophosphatase MutT (NUDIX family)
MTSKKKIERSGVLPYYIDNGQIKILFMKPSDPRYGGDKFQMAKGKHEDGESPLEAGIREASEELGLFRGNIEHTHKLGNFLGRTHVYVCQIKDPSPEQFGDPCFETAETRWMTPEEFQAEGRDLHKPVIKAAVRYIEGRHDNGKDV